MDQASGWGLVCGASTAGAVRLQQATPSRLPSPTFYQKTHSACERSRRVRLSVRVRSQNAPFRRVRFSSPAQTWSHLTQRRILRRRPHVKAQSAPGDSRKTALCTHHLTEKCILCRRCHLDVTKRRILGGRRHGKAHFACGAHQKAHSACGRSRRVRLSVRVRAQNALFRRMCFSLPAQTWGRLTEKRTLDRHLTQKRTLHPSSHGKPHSVPATPRKSAVCTRRLTQKRTLGVSLSRKSAVCAHRLTEKRILHAGGRAECAFP